MKLCRLSGGKTPLARKNISHRNYTDRILKLVETREAANVCCVCQKNGGDYNMRDVRWETPFKRSIPYYLFLKHLTELNEIYWAYVPAASTIEKKSQEALSGPAADPKEYFLIRDEDDRRMAPTFDLWKQHYREFSNYTRLSMLMLLSSCFETYLRTVISLAIESKPGSIIGCPDAIDGVFLLKTKPGYGDINSSSYQFSEVLESICKGDWYTRANNYQKYFGQFPINNSDVKELDELRQKRNLVGHHFGRVKQKYETPISLAPEPAQRISHEKLLKYLSLIHRSATAIDEHLYHSHIGSYDVCKYYYSCLQEGKITTHTVGNQAKELQKIFGSAGFQRVGTEYYHALIAYLALDDKDSACRYGKKTCIKAINTKLSQLGISLYRDGHSIYFKEYHFNLFCKAYGLRLDSDYCVQRPQHQLEYFYSLKTIEFIVSKICENPAGIIEELRERVMAQREE